MTAAYHVAVVDDDISVRESLDSLLRSTGRGVSLFSSPDEFLNSGAAAESACLVLDVDMPGMTGPELFAELLKRRRPLPVIFMTGRRNESLRAQVLANGAAAFLYKPFDEEEMLGRIEEAAADLN